jgi:hypothetical protein
MKIYLGLITMLITMAAAGAIAIGIYLNAELIWGLGIGFGLFYYLLLPALYLRNKNIGRLNPDQALASYYYSPDEARQVAAAILSWQKRRNRWIAPFTSGCLGLMGVIFVVVLHTQFPDPPLWWWFWLMILAVLPFVLRVSYFFYLKRLILKDPCKTIVGRNFLMWGNTIPVFNERETLKATDANLITQDNRQYVEVLYRSITRMRYGGKVEHRDRVLVLIPLGFERAAQDLVTVIRSGKGKQ